MLASLTAQLRHLGVARPGRSGAARLRALKGLVARLVALGGPEKRLQRALRLFENELAGADTSPMAGIARAVRRFNSKCCAI